MQQVLDMYSLVFFHDPSLWLTLSMAQCDPSQRQGESFLFPYNILYITWLLAFVHSFIHSAALHGGLALGHALWKWQ